MIPVFGGNPYVPLTSADWDDRFSHAILVSAIVHTLLMFGLHFKAPNAKMFENSVPPLDVVLVNARSEERPLTADALAQYNLAGGGTVEEDRHAKSPLTASQREQRHSAERAEMDARVQALEAKAQAMMRQLKSDYKAPEAAPQAEVRPPTPDPAPQDLSQRSVEMARLQARIEQEYDEYQKRPRRLNVGASTQEFNLAQYIEAWRIKVERVGNLNYPEAARRNRLYGSLLMSVCIKDDGRLEEVEVMRSSGHKVLDAAARHIVQLAAPFSRFPADLRKNADIICINRTWSFTRSDEFATTQ